MENLFIKSARLFDAYGDDPVLCLRDIFKGYEDMNKIISTFNSVQKTQRHLMANLYELYKRIEPQERQMIETWFENELEAFK
ncbi:MAG: hypothetical protein V4456_11525 [Bacteroidota bacterium]